MTISAENFVASLCTQCGGQTQFSVAKGCGECRICDYTTEVEHHAQLTATVSKYALSADQRDETLATGTTQVSSCTGCGAEFDCFGGSLSTVCSFCGNALLEKKSRRAFAPQAIIPFRIEALAAAKSAVKILKKRHPQLLGKPVQSVLTGVYVPYWLFRSRATTFYQVTPEKTEVLRREKSGRIEHAYVNYAISASHKFTDEELVFLNQWDFGQLKSFDTQYLAGFYAQHYQIHYAEAEQIFYQNAAYFGRLDAQQKMPIYRATLTTQTEHALLRYRLVLLPVWVCKFRVDSQDILIFVNGQSGQIAQKATWQQMSRRTAIVLAMAILILRMLFSSP